MPDKYDRVVGGHVTGFLEAPIYVCSLCAPMVEFSPLALFSSLRFFFFLRLITSVLFFSPIKTIQNL